MEGLCWSCFPQKACLFRIKSISGPIATANIWETFCPWVHYTGVDAFSSPQTLRPLIPCLSLNLSKNPLLALKFSQPSCSAKYRAFSAKSGPLTGTQEPMSRNMQLYYIRFLWRRFLLRTLSEAATLFLTDSVGPRRFTICELPFVGDDFE